MHRIHWITHVVEAKRGPFKEFALVPGVRSMVLTTDHHAAGPFIIPARTHPNDPGCAIVRTGEYDLGGGYYASLTADMVTPLGRSPEPGCTLEIERRPSYVDGASLAGDGYLLTQGLITSSSDPPFPFVIHMELHFGNRGQWVYFSAFISHGPTWK